VPFTSTSGYLLGSAAKGYPCAHCEGAFLQRLRRMSAAAIVLTAARMAALDAALMSPAVGYNLPQLMELAGLSVAQAIAAQYPQGGRVLVISGPGNNGGDGLVCAQHLATFGYKTRVVYPKRPSRGESKELFDGLVTRLANYDVPVLSDMPGKEEVLSDYDLLVDAIFGFSFKGDIRAPFDAIIATMAAVSSTSFQGLSKEEAVVVGADGSSAVGGRRGIPIISVDIPSGWDPDEGDKDQKTFMPEMLVSLTAPKQCARHFKGHHHWLGGRFVPPALAREYGIEPLLALYQGSEQVVKLS
jgi:hydroxyethylthiazole kinase-like uncharacterized protein yjeF